MADDDDDDRPIPDNVAQFQPRLEPVETIEADVLLEDCMGEYSEVIILGVDDHGEMIVSGNISCIPQVYEMLATAAQNIAMAHLEMIFHGTEH